MIRILLYGEIDLNLIDGSAVWLASLAEVLGGLDGVHVSLLLKTPIRRDTLIRDAVILPRVCVLNPWALAASGELSPRVVGDSSQERLSPASAASVLQELDGQSRFDILLVRGTETLRHLLKSPETSSALWAYITNPLQYNTDHGRAELRALRQHCEHILCQTEESKAVLLELTTHDKLEQILILPPMIPSMRPTTSHPLLPSAPRLGYSGKLSEPYRILEMLDAFRMIRAEIPGAEFHVVGDKIQRNPARQDFVRKVREDLEKTPGVTWHGGMSRAQANELLSTVNIAASWRSSEFDTSLELSTKVLEYSALGLPVLMNPSPIQQRLFGRDYPVYVTTQREFVDQFLNLVRQPALYQDVSARVRQVAQQHTFHSHRRRLLEILRPRRASVRSTSCHPTLIWVGHDFKFLDPIRQQVEASGKYRCLTDFHPGHTIRNTQQSKRLLRAGDLIFCEWCLGNAEWYSHHKLPHQRLIVRLHRQEIELPFLDRIHWSNVDRIIFIAEWLQEEFLRRFPQVADRALVIHNAIDTRRLNQEKLPGAQFNLGLLGYCPRLKAPHRAIRLLAALKRLDRRYTLFIKGRSPEQLTWLWRRPEERAYYERLSQSVEASDYCNSIVFEPHADDVDTWLSKIGFVLSTSDYEGSHQAVAEGMASGAIPVIRNWRGADQLYPDKYIFEHGDKAVQTIRHWSAPNRFEEETQACRRFARRFDLTTIAARHLALLQELWAPSASAPVSRCGIGGANPQPPPDVSATPTLADL